MSRRSLRVCCQRRLAHVVSPREQLMEGALVSKYTWARSDFQDLIQLWSHLCKGELPPEFMVKNFPAADWAKSQLLHPRTVKPVGPWLMRADPQAAVGPAQGDLGRGPLSAFNRVTCAIWFRIQPGRPGWEEMETRMGGDGSQGHRGPDSMGASHAATPSPGGLQRKGKSGTRGRSWPSEVRWAVFHSLHLIPKRLHYVSDLITPKELTLSTWLAISINRCLTFSRSFPCLWNLII